MISDTCPACDGVGHVETEWCHHCDGTGIISLSRLDQEKLECQLGLSPGQDVTIDGCTWQYDYMIFNGEDGLCLAFKQDWNGVRGEALIPVADHEPTLRILRGKSGQWKPKGSFIMGDTNYDI